MKLCQLKINDEFLYYGVRHSVFSIKPPDVLIQRIEGDKKVYEVNYYSLISDSSFIPSDYINKRINKEANKSNKNNLAYLDTLSEKKRDIVSKRFEMIKPILMFENIKEGDLLSSFAFKDIYKDFLEKDESILNLNKEKLYKRISERNNISTRQLKRYVASYKGEENESPNHGLDGLIRKHDIKNRVRSDEKAIEICHPKNSELVLDVIYTRLDEEYLPILKEAIEKHYLDKRKITIQNLTDTIEILCYEKNLKSLDYITVHGIIQKRLNPRIKQLLRNGKDALQDYLETSRGFSNQFAKAPLHIVEIDHTELDIDIIDIESGANLGRPWITMGIDVYTRMIWCMHISFEEPSANKVRKAIQHGIFFKRIKSRYNTINEWEISGIPRIFYFDNGPEFDNNHVRRMIDETLESQVMYRPVATPRYGGVIERFFGTINKQFIHKLAGNRKSNPKELGDYDAETEAIFTLEDITELLTTYIVDVYHHIVHKGLPEEFPTPTARYYQGIEVVGFPEFIPAADEGYYEIQLLPTEERMYSRDGVRMDNVYYASKENSTLISKQKNKYKIKYDIDDISRIYLLDPSTHSYLELPAQNPPAESITGMSRSTYKAITKELRAKGLLNIQKIPGSRDIIKGKALLEEKIKAKMKNNKKVRRKALKSGFKLIPAEPEKLQQPAENKSVSQLEILKNKLNYEKRQK
ncbi:transposase family protein [Cytobacillus sp. S13-E01]|uniref:transposase family protein n=1 Tax=Cytobacillus sp. S13-E01 TaxID=3031326 RepID=UPI0023D8C8E6|nr:transposase family protein [Cytobacillus sp. S13-E01]MDF0728652.1 transposase family protein [Cytobacillus sp. S13-E01]